MLITTCCRCSHLRQFIRRIKYVANQTRHLTTTTQVCNMNIFDQQTKIHQKNMAAQLPDHQVYDYLRDEVAERVADRLADITRFFPKALDIGAGKGYLAKQFHKDEVGHLFLLENSEKMLEHCTDVEVETTKIISNEEAILPFENDYFDLAVSSLSMHWINDLPGILSEVTRCLKDDGVFIGAIFGTDTLYELRCSLQLAELEREGGFGPHISPFTEMRDIGTLLQRAGMNLTTIDFDEITIDYPSIFELMEDLKGMGENNATWQRKSVLHRDTLFAASAIYQAMYGNEDGSIPATYQILYMIGWKPSETQSKPLERGSATMNFKDLTNVVELEKNDK